MSAVEKKRLWMFIAIAYGVTYLMGIAMKVGYDRNIDLSVFANAQMFYPACGVILGMMCFKDESKPYPRVAFITMLVTTVILMILSFLSVFKPLGDIELGEMTMSMYMLLLNYVIIIGSVVFYISQWTAGKERRENSGLERYNIKLSIVMVILFLFLYCFRIVLAYVIDGVFLGQGMEAFFIFIRGLGSAETLVKLGNIPLNFFFVFIAFFGEEYGWRYYLQPVMQKKFGLRLGVILLGIVWGLWHLPMDLMFYTKTTGPQMAVNQIFTCIALGIFFAYAYMKTNNIWVPIIMHYLNNNIIAAISENGVDAFQNQAIQWRDIPLYIVLVLCYFIFIISPVFKEKKQAETIGE